MNFKPFKMAQIGANYRNNQGADDSLFNLHSSNPEPFAWAELTDLLGFNPWVNSEHISLDYAPVQGCPVLRDTLAQQYHQSHINADHITLTSGAQEGIFAVMHALLEPGDEVICFTPCFEPLVENATQAGAEVKCLSLKASDGWRINWKELSQTINQKTKLLIVNFPHNPTGTHISFEDQRKLVALCEQYDCWLFSDEVFRGLEHTEQERLPAASDLYDKAISMGVMSKSMALPGIRLGWLTALNKGLLQSINTIKSHLSICQSTLDTHLAQVIIPKSEKIWRRNRVIINQNKTWLDEKIAEQDELFWQQPKAAATGFVQFKSKNAKNLTNEWAKTNKIMVMPNQAFLTDHQGFRLTLGNSKARTYYETLLDSSS